MFKIHRTLFPSVFSALLMTCIATSGLQAQEIDVELPETVYVKITISVSNRVSDGAVLDELQFSTVDNTKANAHFSLQAPVAEGARMIQDRVLKQYRQVQVGTIAAVKPTVSESGILLDLNLEKSWIHPAAESDDSGVTQSSVCSFSLDSTYALKDGQPRIVQAKVTGANDGPQEVKISVTASTNPLTGKTASVRDRQPSRVASSREQARESRETINQSNQNRPPLKKKAGTDHDTSDRRARGVATMFRIIDADGNKKLDQNEWEKNGFAQSLERRGFKFTQSLTLEEFTPLFDRMLFQSRDRKKDTGR